MTDTDGKIKVYKHPDRNKVANYKPYIPQYQIHGKDPGEHRNIVVPTGHPVAIPSTDNPRAKKPMIRQSYATESVPPIGRGRSSVPNVGNNMDHIWSSSGVDTITDDFPDELIDDSNPMIDNNEFVTERAMGFQVGVNANEIQNNTSNGQVIIEKDLDAPNHLSIEDSIQSDDLLPILASLTNNVFLLIVSGVPLCSGPKTEIEDQARALVFGEHEMCEGNPIPVDDILIIKRVEVKVGLFLE